MISEERFYAGIRESTARLAGIVSDEDDAQPIPTCPEWTLRQLATHVGRAQRWAAEIVARRSAEFIPFRDVPDGRLPDDPAERPDWLNSGASRLIDAVRRGRRRAGVDVHRDAPGRLLGPADGARDGRPQRGRGTRCRP